MFCEKKRIFVDDNPKQTFLMYHLSTPILRKALLSLFIVAGTVFCTISAQTAAQMNEWSRQAQEAEENKQYAEAIAYYELYREGYAKNYSESDDTYALVLFKLARCYFNTGNYLKAAEWGEKEAAATLSLYGKADEDFATSMQNLSVYYSRLGDQAKTIDCARIAVEAYKASVGEQHPKYAQALSNLARFLSDRGDYGEAMRMETMAMQVLKTTQGDGSESYITSLNNLSVYCAQLGDASKALEYAQTAQEQLVATGQVDGADYAMTLDRLANYHSSLGDYSKAVELCVQSMRLLRNTVGTNHPDYATVLSHLANNTSLLGSQRRAIDLGTRALTIRQSTLGKDHPLYAQSLNNLSHYYNALGDNTHAVEYGERALAIWHQEADGMNTDYAACLSNLSNYYSALGDIEKAVDYCVRAAEIRKAVLGATHPDYALSLNNLASLFFRHGEYERAKETGTRAMMTSRTSLGEQHPYYATALTNLAGYHAMLGDYDASLDFFGQGISISHANVLQQFPSLTTKQRALFWAKESYEFTDLFPAYTYLAHASSAPDLYDKSCLFAKGLLLSTEIEMNKLIQESGDQEALRMFEELQLNRMLLQQQFETPIAQRHLNTDSLIRLVNRQERALVRRSKVYGDFTQHLHTTWKDVQQALKADELAVEFLSFELYGTDSTMVAALTLRKDDQAPKFTPLFERRRLSQVSDPTFYHCPELTDLVWKPISAELRGIRRIYFSPAGALHNIGIEYAPGMETYEMYRLSTTREVITHSETHPSPPEGREYATTPDPSFPKEGKEDTPLATLYGGIDYDAPATNVTPSLGGGWGEASDGEMLVELHRAFVDSLDMRGLSAKSLPSTLIEVETIKESFERKNRQVGFFVGREATEASFKNLGGHTSPILHIATHGFYFTEKQVAGQSKLRFLGQNFSVNPSLGEGRGEAPLTGGRREAPLSEDKALTRSGLLFAGANSALQGKDIPLGEDDGILTAQEISRMDLRGVELVVLSACQTGKGDINQGEGVFGLQRGFKKAGAKTIVMSLWEVADEATQILMNAFYDQLILGKSKRQAFREAQKELRAHSGGRYDHPQFWAAFVLLD